MRRIFVLLTLIFVLSVSVVSAQGLHIAANVYPNGSYVQGHCYTNSYNTDSIWLTLQDSYLGTLEQRSWSDPVPGVYHLSYNYWPVSGRTYTLHCTVWDGTSSNYDGDQYTAP